MTTRRIFLAGLAALTLPKPGWAAVGNPHCLAAGKTGDRYVLHGLSADGQSLFAIDLPGRGHAAAAHPHRPLAVAFARRPGTFAIALDCRSGKVLHQMAPPDGRQFNGHGVFSAEGGLLYTSEVVADTSEGRIGLWETDGFRRVGEWSSGGIGPHDLKRQANGGLIIANGGIQTDPTDRSKVNIATMKPNLTRLSPEGEITEQVELADEFRQNSIRHLALGQDGTVAFAMQWEGDEADPVPLLGLWQVGGTPRLCPPPTTEAFRMKGYAGSIATNSSGQIALTSPRGGVVMIHAPDGTHLATHARADVCGVTALGAKFLLSDGAGAVWICDDKSLLPLAQGNAAWDNHIVPLT